jgi:hypothetical protein
VVLQVASARVPLDENCTSVSEVTCGHVADGDKALVVVATTTTTIVVVR